MYHLQLKGRASGLLQGGLVIQGQYQPNSNVSRLQVAFQNVQSSHLGRLPLTDLNGIIEFTETGIRLHDLSFKLRSLPFYLSGEISNVSSQLPSWNLNLHVNTDRLPVVLQVRGDLEDQSISGEVTLLGAVYHFEGAITRDRTGFQMHDLMIDNGYRADAVLQLTDGHYQLRAERDRQSFLFDLNLNNFDIDLQFNINHFKFYQHDITTFARLRMSPIEELWEARDYRFLTNMQTDYLIVNYHPFEDFRASFFISQYGIDEFDAHWGSMGRLTGTVDFDESISVDAEMIISSFSLQELDAIGFRHLPSSLECLVEGKITMVGTIEAPEVHGKMTFSEGKIGTLKFDGGHLEFRGHAPYFRVINSKVRRKGNTLEIRGDIDFALNNIFRKLEVVSTEQIILWNGLDLSSELKASAEQHSIAVGGGGEAPTASDYGPGTLGQRKVEIEYAFDEKRSVSVVAEEERNNPLVTVGPKFKF